MKEELTNLLKYYINKNASATDICKALNISLVELNYLINDLCQNGEDYAFVNGNPKKINNLLSKMDYYNINEGNLDSVCFLSDVHYGSIYDNIELMEQVYEQCDKRNINHIFCAGDLTDGVYVEDRDPKEKKAGTIKKLINYVSKCHPYSEKINFYSIAGNHDLITDMKNYDNNMCQYISQNREDIIYLDSQIAYIYFGNTTLCINHGYKKSKVSLQRRLKYYYKQLPDYLKPNILILGHIHQDELAYFDETYVLQLAAMCDPISFSDVYHKQSFYIANLKYDDNGEFVKVEFEKHLPTLSRIRSFK